MLGVFLYEFMFIHMQIEKEKDFKGVLEKYFPAE